MDTAWKQQSQGFADPQTFLVEFLGTHEFIWVRESDIIEEFDVNEDPNQNDNTPRKLQDPCGDMVYDGEELKGEKITLTLFYVYQMTRQNKGWLMMTTK